MKIAVISDIHSNLTALNTCLAYAKHLGAEGYAFLGDIVTDGPDPHALLEQLRALQKVSPCWFVLGNREAYLMRHRDNPNDGWKPSAQTGALLYTYQQLTDEDRRFLFAMPISERLEIEGCPPIRMCHASPTDTTDLFYPGAERADQVLRGIGESTLLSGHSHMQFRYESGGKQLINPGSLGIHDRSMTKAQFALIDCEQGRWNARLLNIEYDRAAELGRYEGSGLDEMSGVYAKLIKLSISTGRNRVIECLHLAQSLAQAGKDAVVDDSYWDAAAKQMGVI